MNIALIGYGKMGHMIEAIARKRGHNIVSIIDLNNSEEFDSQAFASADVAIEFTTPQTAEQNVTRCFEKGVKVVCGTTGWNPYTPEFEALIKQHNATFLYATNYSVGVNILFEINRKLAQIMNNYPNYEVSMEEIHHIHKKDAPSGTAITLANDIVKNIDKLEDWALDTADEKRLNIHAIREGEVAGIHEVRYKSNEDIITIRHEAFSREGFALGAIIAAEYTHQHIGLLDIKDIYK